MKTRTNADLLGSRIQSPGLSRAGSFLLSMSILLLPASGVGAATVPQHTGVSILTQNMDAATDLSFVVVLGAPAGVDLTLAEVQASHLPERAELLAQKIAQEKPDIVALEEVTLWRTGPTPETATNVLYDQLELLLSALASHGADYTVTAVNTLTDVALPGTAVAGRYTDRDVLLLRSVLHPPALHFSNLHTRRYEASFNFLGLPLVQGYISIDVHTGNQQFRLVMTHLESPVPGVPEATGVQVAQAGELIDALRNLTIPVVLCGDFNSDANFGNLLDGTPSVALFEAAGYNDLWKVANPSDPGATWPLYLEDQAPPDFFAFLVPFERIDLFFGKDINVTDVKEVLAPAATGALPSFGSDHAGVLATLQP